MSLSYKRLGFTTYKEYLESDRWKEIREKVFAFYGKRCYFCFSIHWLQVHHVAYTRKTLRIGRMENLIPLCGSCHDEVTQYVKKYGCTVRKATEHIARLHNRKLQSKKQVAKRALEEAARKKQEKIDKRRKLKEEIRIKRFSVRQEAQQLKSKSRERTLSMRIITSSQLPETLHHSIHACLGVWQHLALQTFIHRYEKRKRQNETIKGLYFQYKPQVIEYLMTKLLSFTED
jgi:hypothetical protein